MASSDVVLSAALRNNLLSLQNTQRNIDTVQLRLATGLKVNSALDNPQSFFTAQSLKNRASDLTRLLDNINLSIQTITEADKGVTALTDLLNQAQSIVNSARDELASSGNVARALGNVDLSNEDDLTTIGGIATGDNFSIATTDDAGLRISRTITITTGDTIYTLAAKITDTFADNENGEITATVTDEGFISIQSVDGRSFRMIDQQVGNGAEVTNAGFTALGLGNYFEIETINNAGANTRAAATIIAGNTLSSISLYESAGNLVDAGDAIAGATIIDADGNTVLSTFAANDDFTFDVYQGSTTTTVAFSNITATTTFQDLIDAINVNSTINDLIEAEFDSSTGQIKFTSLSDTVTAFGITVNTAGAATWDIGLGDPHGTLDPITTGAGVNEERVYSFNNSTQALDSLASDFNSVREQINQLVVDANFRGVNLLNGDDLITFFNEDNTSSLTTEGAVFTSDGLGITEASFRGSTTIELSASQTRDALTAVRNFGSSLATSLSVVQTRRDFTEETINTLKAGAEDLTVADQNEEGANLLALQTRQQLGVTSLALAAQSQQSVLRLF